MKKKKTKVLYHTLKKIFNNEDSSHLNFSECSHFIASKIIYQHLSHRCLWNTEINVYFTVNVTVSEIIIVWKLK